MAFVPVPKDLNRVKTKVMFNLTKRQLICFSIAAAVGVPIFFLVKAHLDLSTAAMLMVVIMLPFIFFALYEKDGQPAWGFPEDLQKVVLKGEEPITCRPGELLEPVDFAAARREVEKFYPGASDLVGPARRCRMGRQTGV